MGKDCRKQRTVCFIKPDKIQAYEKCVDSLYHISMKKGKNKGSQQNRRREIRKKRPQPLF